MRKKFEGILLVSDFDGTLSYRRNISRENSEAIRYFQENGGLFTLASGRQLGWMEQWKHLVCPNTLLSLVNGAVICDPEEQEIYFREYSGRALLELSDRIFEACPKLEFVNHSLEGELYRQEPGEILTPEILARPVYKSVYHVLAEDSDEYTARIREIAGEEFVVMRSWINGIEVLRRDLNKGSALRRMKTILGDAVRLTVAAGNYENDVDLLQAADIGYAVGDAIPSVKAVADRITVNCADHAIAAIIAELEQRDLIH